MDPFEAHMARMVRSREAFNQDLEKAEKLATLYLFFAFIFHASAIITGTILVILDFTIIGTITACIPLLTWSFVNEYLRVAHHKKIYKIKDLASQRIIESSNELYLDLELKNETNIPRY